MRLDSDLADKIGDILQSRGLTVHQVSEFSAQWYGRSSPGFIPHNFYRSLRSIKYGPRLEQLCTLSRVSGYRLRDWLALLRLDLSNILELQVALPRKRTMLLDTSLDLDQGCIPWFRERSGVPSPAGIVPLGLLLEQTGLISLEAVSRRSAERPLYAKIGSEDNVAFPELAAGSIVRIRARTAEMAAPLGKLSDKIFLIEHPKGLWCSRLHFTTPSRIYPVSTRLPFARIPLEIPHQARILGEVDLEIRPVTGIGHTEVPKDLVGLWEPQGFSQANPPLGRLLGQARKRCALSLREASSLSRQIAHLLGDERYFIASGSLSDYEAETAPPRQLQKSVALCSIYGIPFSAFLDAMGIDRKALGQEPMRAYKEGKIRGCDETIPAGPNLRDLLAQMGSLPLFLRNSLGALSEMKGLSVRDFFWIRPETRIHHPQLHGAVLMLANRRKKRPIRPRWLPLLEQPLFILLLRDGRYICANCSEEGGDLILHSQVEGFHSPYRIRNHDDAEVIGQVVMILRKLP
jgi:hypothetical protein